MRQRGFWDHLFDSNYRQRSDINEALDSMATVNTGIGNLEHNQQRLHQKVVQLALTVDVLMDILEERGLLDEHELDRRVDERLHPPPPPPQVHSGAPYRDSGIAEPPPRPVMTVCTRCEKQVPAPSTQITANGVVCDRCFAMG